MVNVITLLRNLLEIPMGEKQLTFADPGTAPVAVGSPCHLLGP